MNLTDEEKLSLTLEVLKVSRETLEAGHDVNDLISHGIDLISILLPKTSNCEELRYGDQSAGHQLIPAVAYSTILLKQRCDNDRLTWNFLYVAGYSYLR